MILTQQTVIFLTTAISLTFAYFVITTLSGYFKAWCAHICGDDTPAHMGFLTLNPMNHLDPIGYIFLIFAQFGWGRYIPVNPLNIHGAWRKTKIACVFLADSFAHIILSFTSLVTLLLLFNKNIIAIAHMMILYRNLSHMTLAHAYPKYPAFVISLGLVLIGIMYLGVILSVLQGVINSVHLGIMLASEKKPHVNINPQTMFLILIFIFIILPITGILDIVGILRGLVLFIISYSGTLFAQLLGYM